MPWLAAAQNALRLSQTLSECEADKVSLQTQLRQAEHELQDQDDTFESFLHTAQEVAFP